MDYGWNDLFDQFWTDKGGSKVKFRTIHNHVIDERFEFSLSIPFISLNWIKDEIFKSLKGDQKLISEKIQSRDL